ncbi:Uncharacterized protein Fot_35527 [Forsythia ovata]|uniref:Uncharacterized protein n=1 Tax=Forsythia ovata TaxID=205694 RepID=A0ABD1SLS5_9LAMI
MHQMTSHAKIRRSPDLRRDPARVCPICARRICSRRSDAAHGSPATVHEHWLATKNACQQMSDRQVIRPLLDTLSPREDRIDKLLLKELESSNSIGKFTRR